MAKRNEYADRAKIFAPFDALKGFKEALKEKEKIVVEKRIISQEEKEKIGNILKEIKKNDMVEIIYFNNGEYIKVKGIVSKIDLVYLKITIVTTKIDFNDIYKINLDNVYIV